MNSVSRICGKHTLLLAAFQYGTARPSHTELHDFSERTFPATQSMDKTIHTEIVPASSCVLLACSRKPTHKFLHSPQA